MNLTIDPRNVYVDGIGPVVVSEDWNLDSICSQLDEGSRAYAFVASFSKGDENLVVGRAEGPDYCLRAGYRIGAERSELIRHIRRVASAIEEHSMGEECIDTLPGVVL